MWVSLLLAPGLQPHNIKQEHFLKSFPRWGVITVSVPHPVGPKRARRGRGPGRPAPHDAPPRSTRACAMHTKRPRAPRREVRGLREAVSGASGPDGVCGLGAEPAGGRGTRWEAPHPVRSASALRVPPGSEKWRFRFWTLFSKRVLGGRRQGERGGLPGSRGGKFPAPTLPVTQRGP